MGPVLFNVRDSASIIYFLYTFPDACDAGRISNGCAIWLLQHFMSGTAKTALASHICSSSADPSVRPSEPQHLLITRLQQKLTSYPHIIYHLINDYATNQCLTEEDTLLLNLRMRQEETLVTFADRLSTYASCFEDAYEDGSLRSIFINGVSREVHTEKR